jgi:hypothetical protein
MKIQKYRFFRASAGEKKDGRCCRGASASSIQISVSSMFIEKTLIAALMIFIAC